MLIGKMICWISGVAYSCFLEGPTLGFRESPTLTRENSPQNCRDVQPCRHDSTILSRESQWLKPDLEAKARWCGRSLDHFYLWS